MQQNEDLKVLCLAGASGLSASDRFEWDLEGGWCVELPKRPKIKHHMVYGNVQRRENISLTR